ncbi:hypothetical protein LIER_32900 [Lithospermum erythrorhizon]|uniref:Uncharacterized protein n=1 Tax=Lithospermum erythrorhizon TaxID=34254 RepID=A0AAV3RZ74_LITER
MWISIVGFYSACLLAGVAPTAEFFLTSFSQRTKKDEFLYFVVKTEMKGFYEAFLSKVEPKTWRPFFFFASDEVLPLGVPSGFTSHPKSKSAPLRTAKHKADAIAFSTYWADRRPMPLHFYSDHRVLRAVDLFLISDACLGALEALRVTFNVPDHAPSPPPEIPAASSDQLPLSLFQSVALEVSLLLPEPHGVGPNTSQGSMGDLSTSTHPPLGQDQNPLPPADHAPSVTRTGASGHSATIFLESEDHGEVGSSTPQAPPSTSPRALEPLTTRLSPSVSGGSRTPKKRMGSPVANPSHHNPLRRGRRLLFHSPPPCLPRFPWYRRDLLPAQIMGS